MTRIAAASAALLLAAGFSAAGTVVPAQPSPSSSTDGASQVSDLPKCPEWADGIPVPMEHASDVCDFDGENNAAVYALNGAALRRSLTSGEIFKMKDEETWHCPEDDAVSAEESPAGAYVWGKNERLVGPKVKWIVRNRSSNPVSVALVDTSRENLEVSAVNPKITPAHNDPKAVLAPGAWKAVDVIMGTVLHVRELITSGEDVAPGRVLLRHRSGPVGIKDTTVKPVVKKPSSKKKSAKVGGGKVNSKKGGGGDDRKLGKSGSGTKALAGNSTRAPKLHKKDELKPKLATEVPPDENRSEKEAQRGKFALDRLCNSLNRLFVNRVGKPVDVYWAGASDLSTQAGTATDRANECRARFAFHLGVNATPHEGFFEQWESSMSFENSYLGHRFVARLASNHSKVLHEVSMDRADVTDCLGDRAVAGVGLLSEGVDIQVAGKLGDGGKKVVNVHEIVVEGTGGFVVPVNLTGVNMGTA